MKCLTPFVLYIVMVLAAACSEEPTGLAPAGDAQTTVMMDFFHEPLPEIPLPNDIATRHDPTSPTGRRINASMLAPTFLESRTRELLDELDGWGVSQPISIPFSGPIDVESIIAGHRDTDYATANDVIYVFDVDPDSPEYGDIQHIDLGEGNFPEILEDLDKYAGNDPRGWTLSLLFEEADEDVNGNGVLDPGEDTNRNGQLDPGEDLDDDGILDPPEDTDADGVLDAPNYLPGHSPQRDDVTGRADALMTFYERETNTVIARPIVPLREATTYAVVVTRRLLDEAGEPVGSPYPGINHNAHTAALSPLPEILSRHGADVGGLGLDDVAFAFTFTTQTLTSDFVHVRQGLYGYGVQAHLAEEYPAELSEIYRVVDEDMRPNFRNPYILPTELISTVLTTLAPALAGSGGGDAQAEALIESHQYIDYHVVGSFMTPQLFERFDENGVPLSYNDQSWPHNLNTTPVQARSEEAYFWLAVPRPENSARGRGEPAPLVVYAHGYTSNHLDAMAFAGFFAQHGFATLAIDNVSHGIVIKQDDWDTYRDLAGLLGLGEFLDAVNRGRAIDLDGDEVPDSGEDYYTAYAFHTRDNIRQVVLDYMQLVRIARTFGEGRWQFDLDGDGENEIAGDFDADGVPDVASGASICALGVSLGSMVASILASTEPALDCSASALQGGVLADGGLRSHHDGVPEANALRLMGPLYLGDIVDGNLSVTAVVPQGNNMERILIARVDGPQPGDTLVVVNESNHEQGCGYITAEGRVRAAVESDKGDLHRLVFYEGPSLVTGSEHCEVVDGAQVRAMVTAFGHGLTEDWQVEFESELFVRHQRLVAIADGFALRRANPEIRRLLSLAQAITDRADPAAYASQYRREPLRYPAMNEVVSTSVLMLAMVGDMSVPTNGSAAVARAFGILDYLEVDPRYGVPPNQVLIDTFAMEGVHRMNRFQYGSEDYEGDEYPEGIHMDVENFSEGDDIWGDNVPRLDPPLRLAGPDSNNRVSGAFFGYARPYGEHGFPLPYELRTRVREACLAECPEGDDCDCFSLTTFDPSFFYLNMMGHFLGTGGRDISTDLCLSANDCNCDPEVDGEHCPSWPEPPEARLPSVFDNQP